MSRFTDQMYRNWLGQNGSFAPRRRPAGGMGGVPPMVTAAPAPTPGYLRGMAAANDESTSRPDKQDVDYVDKSKKLIRPLFFLISTEDYYLGDRDYDYIHRI